MAASERPPRPAPKALHAVSDVIADRIRDVREKRKLTVRDLAARCAAAGAPELTADALFKLETRRASPGGLPRPVTADELMVLALVLNVAPVHLLVPTDDRPAYQITPTVTADPGDVRAFIRGQQALGDADPRDYMAEQPAHEFYYLSPSGEQITQARPRKRARRRQPAEEKTA